MTAPLKILMPLRVPELAPSLGRLLVPRRLAEPWVPIDDVREELATRVIELGGGAPRGGLARTRSRGGGGRAALGSGDRGHRALATGTLAGVRPLGARRGGAALVGIRPRWLPPRAPLARRLAGLLESAARVRDRRRRRSGGGRPGKRD